MRKELLIALGLMVFTTGFAQKDDKTIATVNKEKITVGEFKKVYEKNLNAIDNADGKDVAKNLDLYINYKLKVKEAYDTKLDTLKSYKREVLSYKNQLTAPYLQDKGVFNELVKEAYNRMKTEIRASHILIRLPRGYKPADTLKAFKKINEIRMRIVNGEDFSKVAKEVSEDPSARQNSGDLGYFKAFDMVYNFEDSAYGINEGEVSEPFRTRFGYHITTKTGSRPSKGERQIAHILINDTTAVGKLKIDNIYNQLREGKDFAALAKQHSKDGGSAKKGGMLPKFGSGKMVKTFEDAAFSIKKVGDFTEPVKTRFGWHVLKFVKDYPVGSFNDMKTKLEERVRRTGRAKRSDEAVLNRLKKEYIIEEVASSKKVFDRGDFRNIPEDSLQSTILKINEKEIRQFQFLKYTEKRRNQSIKTLFKNFKDQEILTYFKDNLKNTNPKFAETLKEYEDGLLLFELMQRRIWEKSNDSIALKNFFDRNIVNYNSRPLKEVKGKVMNDYQNSLEEGWIKELRDNNNIKINNKILNKLIKYYRKES